MLVLASFVGIFVFFFFAVAGAIVGDDGDIGDIGLGDAVSRQGE